MLVTEVIRYKYVVFVTNINATSGNSYDGDVMVPIVNENIANCSKPEKICGDAHYGSAENRYQMSAKGITISAPFGEAFNTTGLFTQEEFIIEENGVICPAGYRTMISNYNEKEGTATFFFKMEICQKCVMKNQCTKKAGRTL